ncbi:MAG TPA: gamma-glutamyl-gamma-aminobutyrate hydrolase family protein [Terracidiphilus sp.]|nr:gamma-glutamyl-gamma-aminobutyrate hydrolase family protein [Terracidiphilus sp.]
MPTKIAIPEPTFSDAKYNGRTLPLYMAALQAFGAFPVIISLREAPDVVARLVTGTQGVLLPGSCFDVDPECYGQRRIPECGPADPARTAVDELLLQDAFNLRKPILAICHGFQALNVWLNGSLIQDIDAILHSGVNHRSDREVMDAHSIRIAPGSLLQKSLANHTGQFDATVNSSHHQALGRVGDRLQVTAVSPEDDVIEAAELTSSDHFVLGVQWHPERTFTLNELSSGIFEAFVRAVENWKPIPERMAQSR